MLLTFAHPIVNNVNSRYSRVWTVIPGYGHSLGYSPRVGDLYARFYTLFPRSRGVIPAPFCSKPNVIP